jgi:uncharacterized protein YbjT (DUF2867 family)
MILLTGAAGKTGRAVLRALSQKGQPVRALVHHAEQMDTVSSIGAHESLAGDMNSPAVIGQAVQGVQAIYHICPNISPDEVPIAEVLIKAALDVGVAHFVFHSVLKPQTESMPHHWKKLRVEEMLIESGLPYTILQPAAYMQNILTHWESIQNEGLYPVPYPAETRLSLVDLDDVAMAAAIVLTDSGHDYAAYELVGTVGLSQTQVAGILSQELDRPVRVVTVPLESWKTQAIATGMRKYQVETLLSMFRYYQDHNFMGNPHTLSWLLDRPPTSLKAFVERPAQEQSSFSTHPHSGD